MKERYDIIDILKFVCAIFVVGIHTQIMNNSESDLQWYILHIVFRIAVPFFFISSGFFYGKKYKKDKENLKEISKKQIKRLLIPFCFWMLISLPYNVIITKGTSVVNVTLKVIRNAIFYPWGALWFVLALIVAIILEYMFLKRDKLKYAMGLSGILFIISLLGNSYYFLLEGTPFKYIMDMYLKICISTRNGLFVGFPLFTVGVYIAQKENLIKNLKNIKLYGFLALAIMVQIFEVTIIRNCNYKDDHSLFFSTIFIVSIILMLSIKYKNIQIKKINTKLLRNLSTGIYFMHSPIIRYFSLLNMNIGKWQMFSMTIIITISISLILHKINNKYINSVIS